jgi:hypothetical protein
MVLKDRPQPVGEWFQLDLNSKANTSASFVQSSPLYRCHDTGNAAGGRLRVENQYKCLR